MKPRSAIQLALLFLLVAAPTEGFFFEYPKKALLDFFHTLKGKKEAKKGHKQENHIRHYHLHYYPAPVHVVSGVHKAPGKRELDDIHSENLRSLGWSDYEYKYVPEPQIAVAASVQETWKDASSPLFWSSDALEDEINDEHHGILVQVPVHQHIIVPHPKDEAKGVLALFHKFARERNSVDS